MTRILSQSEEELDISILDEGIVHPLWSAALRGGRPLNSKALASNCLSTPLTWLLVRVDCEQETLRRRLAGGAERTGYHKRLHLRRAASGLVAEAGSDVQRDAQCQ